MTWEKKGPGKVTTAKRGEGVAVADPAGSGKVYFSLLPQQSRYALPEPHGHENLDLVSSPWWTTSMLDRASGDSEAIRIPSEAIENSQQDRWILFADALLEVRTL